MTTNDSGTNVFLQNLERELVCFICTEILYQPLTIIDCLHSFCGAHLKEWFIHQYRRAKASHANPSSNPYTCPTCRSSVIDVRPQAMVNTYLDILLAANPSRARSQEDKDEMAATYTPGENIIPKLDSGRRRERRTRRDEDEARERRVLEEVTQRSLQEIQGPPVRSEESLHVPPRQHQTSRSRDREREERRERRREQERQRRRQRDQEPDIIPSQDPTGVEDLDAVSTSLAPPASSPRHPEAVEVRQRQQTVAHQPSLVSLISSSEGTGSGTTDSLDEARVMQEILAAGFLDGIDVDAMTEAEQDVLSERIAELYRQMHQRDAQQQNSGETVLAAGNLHADHTSFDQPIHSTDQRSEERSASGQRRAETFPAVQREDSIEQRPRSARTHPTDSTPNLLRPQAIVTHRRRSSNQSQTNVGTRNGARHSVSPAPSANGVSRPAVEVINSASPAGADVSTVARPETQPRSVERASAMRAPVPPPSVPMFSSQAQLPSVPLPESLAGSSATFGLANVNITPNASQISEQSPARFDEPSISCYRCHRADIQYEVYQHCEQCKIDLCRRCYRTGRGCNHWFGFGKSAIVKFEAATADRRDTEPVEPPHVFVGRSVAPPASSSILTSKLAKDGHTPIPLTTTSNPQSRSREGRFCDRCSAFADSCFWACEYCNDGEWGFCSDCVNTHRCCTHPLLPTAHESTMPTPKAQASQAQSNSATPTLSSTELQLANLEPSAVRSQITAATPAIVAPVSLKTGYRNLKITTRCDICTQAIPPTQSRHHCPFHPSPTESNAKAIGDYDICTPCYHELVKTNRIKREDGPVGWRKCLSNHRMIITTFEPDEKGNLRRVVLNDLVGGWKFTDRDINAWMASMSQRRDQQSSAESPTSPTFNFSEINPGAGATWTWREDQNTARRGTRARALTFSPNGSPYTANSTLSSTPSSPVSSSYPKTKFPPDSGFGAWGVAWWSYYPDEGEDGKGELMFPRGAEVREIEDVNGEWWEGVYAGAIGVAPAGYVQW